MTSLTGAERRIAVVVAIGGLLSVLDTTIVVVAAPQLMVALHGSLTDVQWVATAYALGMVTTLPVAAVLADRWGARRVYVCVLLVFAGASAMAGAAPGLGWLIVARAVQGMAGGLVNPLGANLGLGAVEPARRGRMIAITGLPLLIGPILGPLLGGLLLTGGSWRSLFFVTVPPALLAAVGAMRWVPVGAVVGRRPVDVVGGLLLVPGVVALSYGLGAESVPRQLRVAIVVAGVGLIGVFVRRSWWHPAPLLQVRLLRDGVFGRGAAVLALYAAPYFGSMLLLPIYVQALRGDGPLSTALLMVPGALGMGASIQVAARVMERTGPRVVVGIGLGLAIAQAVTLVFVLRPDTSYAVLAVLGVVQGAGTGAIMMPTIVGASRNLQGRDLASGVTILPLVVTISTALGTAAVTASFAGFVAWTTGGRTLGALGAGAGHDALVGDIVTAYRATVAATVACMVVALVVRLRGRSPRLVARSRLGAASGGVCRERVARPDHRRGRPAGQGVDERRPPLRAIRRGRCRAHQR